MLNILEVDVPNAQDYKKYNAFGGDLDTDTYTSFTGDEFYTTFSNTEFMKYFLLFLVPVLLFLLQQQTKNRLRN